MGQLYAALSNVTLMVFSVDSLPDASYHLFQGFYFFLNKGMEKKSEKKGHLGNTSNIFYCT